MCVYPFSPACSKGTQLEVHRLTPEGLQASWQRAHGVALVASTWEAQQHCGWSQPQQQQQERQRQQGQMGWVAAPGSRAAA